MTKARLNQERLKEVLSKRTNSGIMGGIETASGLIVVYGGFTKIDGHQVGRIAVLNNDEKLSLNLNKTRIFGSGANDWIWSISSSGNKLHIQGDFTSFDNYDRGHDIKFCCEKKKVVRPYHKKKSK